MLALLWLPTAVPFFLLLGAAIALGAAGSALALDIPLWGSLLVIAVSAWIVTFTHAVCEIRGNGVTTSLRFRNALKEHLEFGSMVKHIGYGFLLCAPLGFILTGAFLTWLAIGAIGFVVSTVCGFAAVA